MENLKKFNAVVNIVNGAMVPLCLYWAFSGNHIQLLFAGLNGYLFISGLDNIKEQFFKQEVK